MEKVTLREHEGSLDLAIEGQLTGTSLQQLVDGWMQVRRRAEARRVLVDISRVTYVGTMAKQFLRVLHHRWGCELACTNPENAHAQNILRSVEE